MDPFELCGPEGLYPVCYVNCNADCGDVAPAQNPIRCQSKKACEEFKANSTREGRSEPVPERPDPEQTTSNPITNRPFTEATTTKSIVFPETTTTPIKRINPDEGRFLESTILVFGMEFIDFLEFSRRIQAVSKAVCIAGNGGEK